MRRLAVLAFFLVAGCGSFGAVQAHNLSLAYKAGETYKYNFHAAFKYTVGAEGMSIPLDMDITAKETLTVKSVDSTGTADVSVAVSDTSMKMTVNGTTNTTTTTTTTNVDMKVASDGRIVSINGSTFGNSSLPGMTGSEGGLVSAILPDKPVKPGDTWSKSYDQANPLGSGSSKVTTANKYLRDEKVGSVDAAVVESKINTSFNLTIDLSSLAGSPGTPLIPPTGAAAGLQGMTMTGTSVSDVTSWIDAGARRVIKSHSTGTLDATMTLNMAAGAASPGLTGPITFKGTQTVDMTPA
ncbi:MAG: hypothetical protein E6J06_06825 [Chloroflexi bacterium]|nr:MAG: hypothetical protein E6J06_06825 [Chloroflexota bacterium]